jgi:hypothetical protein
MPNVWLVGIWVLNSKRVASVYLRTGGMRIVTNNPFGTEQKHDS